MELISFLLVKLKFEVLGFCCGSRERGHGRLLLPRREGVLGWVPKKGGQSMWAIEGDQCSHSRQGRGAVCRGRSY